jgi:hypothetical protein
LKQSWLTSAVSHEDCKKWKKIIRKTVNKQETDNVAHNRHLKEDNTLMLVQLR